MLTSTCRLSPDPILVVGDSTSTKKKKFQLTIFSSSEKDKRKGKKGIYL
jgi:hypothetical protein